MSFTSPKAQIPSESGPDHLFDPFRWVFEGSLFGKKVSFLIINPSKSPKWVIWGSVDPF